MRAKISVYRGTFYVQLAYIEHRVLRETNARKGHKFMTENEEKRLQGIREKMKQLRAQEHSFIAQVKARERKLRTRRLIQNGALAEKYLDCENMEPIEFEKVLKHIVDTLNVVDENGSARGADRLQRNNGIPK